MDLDTSKLEMLLPGGMWVILDPNRQGAPSGKTLPKLAASVEVIDGEYAVKLTTPDGRTSDYAWDYITWDISPTPATWGKTLLKGPDARFRAGSKNTGIITATATVRVSGTYDNVVMPVVVNSTVPSGIEGVFPKAYTHGEDVVVETVVKFAKDMGTVPVRLVQTAHTGVEAERVIVEERQVKFAAGDAVRLAKTMSYSRPSGWGEGFEYRWEVDAAPDYKIISGILPVWVHGLKSDFQHLEKMVEYDTPDWAKRPAADAKKASSDPAEYQKWLDINRNVFQTWTDTGLNPDGSKKDRHGPFLNLTHYNMVQWQVDLDDPNLTYRDVEFYDFNRLGRTPDGWFGNDAAARPYPRNAVAKNVPIPESAFPAAGTDRSMVIVGLRGGKVERIWESWIMQRMSNGKWRAAGMATTTPAELGQHSVGYTSSASGISNAYTVTRISEAQKAVAYIREERAAGRKPDAGVIASFVKHPLSIVYPDPADKPPSWPATFHDGTHPSPYMLREGQIMYLSQDADIHSRNYSDFHLMIAAVAQKRGFFLSDRSNTTTAIIFEHSDSYGVDHWAPLVTGGGKDPFRVPDEWIQVGKVYSSKSEWDADTGSSGVTI